MAKVVKKGKKIRKKKRPSKKWLLYKEKRKSCPRCGPGIFLAQHKNRLYCGKCHYTEFLKEEK